jgi:hypothetical protein
MKELMQEFIGLLMAALGPLLVIFGAASFFFHIDGLSLWEKLFFLLMGAMLYFTVTRQYIIRKRKQAKEPPAAT